MRQAHNLTASLLICLLLPSSAGAAQTASLHVSFTPKTLGRATNVEFTVRVIAPADHVPPPLTGLALHYPRDLGLAVSGLGLVTCSLQTLTAFGPKGCPADSRMGQGSALTEVELGSEIITETADVAILRAAEQENHIGLVFYANARTPISTEVAFPGLLLPAPPPQDESISIAIPLVAVLPEAPDVSVIELHATFGPRGLTYYERIHGQLVPYKPTGVLLPSHCPPGGFQFTATLDFADNASTSANATVTCPTIASKQHHGRAQMPRHPLKRPGGP